MFFNFLDHLVIKGIRINPANNTLSTQQGLYHNINKNLSDNYENQFIHQKTGNNNYCDYNKFDEIPNEFANHLNYPTLEKIDLNANYPNENFIRK